MHGLNGDIMLLHITTHQLYTAMPSPAYIRTPVHCTLTPVNPHAGHRVSMGTMVGTTAEAGRQFFIKSVIDSANGSSRSR